MKEKEYITITNRLKIMMAINIIRDILPGHDGVTTKEKQKEILKCLYEWEEKLFEAVEKMQE